MGFAKYHEDDIEIIQDRLINRAMKNSYLKLTEDNDVLRQPKYHSADTKDKKLVALREIYSHMNNINVWINFYQEVLQIIETKHIQRFIIQRLEELDQVLDYYTNEFYDCQYDEIRNRVLKDKNRFTKESMEQIIKLDFLETCINYFKCLENHTMKEALRLRTFYCDMDQYVQRYFSDTYDNKTNIIINIVEDIVKTKNINKTYKCENCGKSTYVIFNICLHCDYSRGEKK